jgi:hypothetical protein
MGFPDISDASNWIDGLKTLVPLLASITTTAIAVIVAIISHRQWKTNQEKLRLDLYNRRFEIYRRCLDSLRTAAIKAQDKEARHAALDRLLHARLESQFLFPESSGVQDLLRKFLTIVSALAGTDVEAPAWEQLINQGHEFIDELTKKMAPFLNFHDL